MTALDRLREITVEYPDQKLTRDVITQAAQKHGVDPNLMRAVQMQESSGEAFAEDGKAIIAYERHWFSRLTGGRYDKSYPSISYPKFTLPKRGADHPMNWSQDERWGTLVFAASLDYEAAVQSVSYGMFQIMGFNYRRCGFDSPEAMVDEMHVSEHRQFQVWLTFLKKYDCLAPLQNGDLLAFAMRYNTGANWRDPAKYGSPSTAARRYAAGLSTRYKTLSGAFV